MTLFGDKSRLEIERKFLLSSDDWGPRTDAVRIRQGFLSLGEPATVRVRAVPEGGVITIKGPTRGMTREEFEYRIPAADADRLLEALCLGTVIDKIRYRIPLGDVVWEVDVFEGANRGLVLAEVELESEDQEVEPPPWIGEEVTGDSRYFNSYLAEHPYRTW